MAIRFRPKMLSGTSRKNFRTTLSENIQERDLEVVAV